MRKPIVIITGGSSGLGKCLAKEFLALKKSICLIARNEKILKKTKVELISMNSNAEIIIMPGNVANEEFVEDLYSALNFKGYYPKYLINCAGIGIFDKVEMVSKNTIYKVFAGNLTGLILMCGKALQYMKYDECFIINIMSTAALRGKANEAIYCAAKWGARGYTEALKNAVKNTKVHVIGIFPGGMNTDFWRKCGYDKIKTQDYMDPSEVAKKIMFQIICNENYNDIYIERESV